MDSLYLLTRFVWIFSMGVSFSICTLTAIHPYSNRQILRRGRVFMAPLTLYALHVMHLVPDFDLNQIFWIGETMLLVLVILATWEGSRSLEKIILPFILLPLAAGGCLYLIHTYLSQIIKSVPRAQYTWTLLIPVAGIFIIRRKQGGKTDLFVFGSLLLLASYGIHFFDGSLFMPEVSLTLQFLAYGLWLFHFTLTAREEALACRLEMADTRRKIEKSVFYSVHKLAADRIRQQQDLLENAKRDELTGVLNRISIMDMIEQRIRGHREEPFTLLMLDIDHFKAMNETQGHETGNLVLEHLAAIADEVVREEDRIGRYGEDEFLILLSTQTLPEARQVAERVKEAVESHQHPVFTISIGISVYPMDGETVVELIDQADKGVYKSKVKGGNAISHVRLL